jgi:hypothetical protein
MQEPQLALHEVVELRVHGVHGTSPATMLGVDAGEVRQVAGDNLTGLYRSKDALPYRQLTGTGVSVEAYSWGTLTSGVRGFFGWVQRALWILLLPFALANLAYWARLELHGTTMASRAGARLTRLGALLLTVFMVLIPSIIGVDLVAWQCYRGDSPGCTPLPGLFDFMADLSAGQRLAVGSLLPLAFVAVLWVLSRQSLLRYEEVTYSGDDPEGGQRMVLRHATLWSGKVRTQQLQRVHLTVALAVVVAFTGVHAVSPKVHGSSWMWLPLVAAGALALAATAWAMVIHTDDVEYPGSRWFAPEPTGERPWLRDRLPRLLLRAMCGTTVLNLLLLWLLHQRLDQQADFVGHNLWFIAVFVALTAVHLALFTGERMQRTWSLTITLIVLGLAAVALLGHLGKLPAGSWVWLSALVVIVALIASLGWWQVRMGAQHGAQAWNGAGASVQLAAAAWVALLFTTGAVIATANYLNGGSHGVEDLVSGLADTDSIATEAVADPSEGTTLEATGDVVIRDAVITLDGSLGVGSAQVTVPVIHSGTVQAERLFDVREHQLSDLKPVALQKGRTRLDRGVVVLDTDSVRIQDSCVRLSDTSPCSPESSRFLVGGMLQLTKVGGPGTATSPRIKISGAKGTSVELATTSPPSVPLVVPQVLIWAPLAQTAWLLLSIPWLIGALVVFLRRSGPAVDAQVERDGISARDRADCRKARRHAAFAHRAERLLDVVGSITAPLAIALIACSATGNPPWRHGFLRPFATVGMYVALGLGLGLVLLFSRVRTSEGTRKAVGVLWDLTTFWPRAAHPLAPPCYAERVVPELRTRVDWALHYTPSPDGPDLRAGNHVVLSGHSQGSVIVCAVLSRLPDADLGRIQVITYGSQIRALYGRIFPAVFGPDQIGYQPTAAITRISRAFPDAPDEPDAAPPEAPAPVWEQWPGSLVERLVRCGGAWVNLFRRSDPLGFRVFSDRDAEPDRYVPEVPDVVVGDAGPRVNTHSGYQHTLAYRTAVAVWTGEAVQQDPVGTADLPPLPV